MTQTIGKYSMTDEAYRAVQRIRQGYLAIHRHYPSWQVIFNNIPDDIKEQVWETGNAGT